MATSSSSTKTQQRLQQCEVCTVGMAKYKCPVCVARYCSVACFGVHKGSAACVATSSSDASNGAKHDIADGIIVSKKKRGRDDDLLHVVSAEALERVIQLPSVQSVIVELQKVTSVV
jgi:hypothetical protein